jgi:SAM-dependent methyltransferase
MSLFQNPRGYVLAIEGVALLRAFCGEHDASFTQERLEELRSLLDATVDIGDPIQATPLTTIEGYETWAPVYDLPGNGCFDLDEPIIANILDSLPAGDAADIACGTGRLSGRLREHGHAVVGVDTSPDMLAIARRRWPALRFLEGNMLDLPLADASVDVALCALALNHIPQLPPAFNEFARILRPGGHLIVSDIRGFLDTIRPPIVQRRPDGSLGYLPLWVHRTSDYLTAALSAGFDVRRCDEPVRNPIPLDDPSWQVPRPTPVGEPPNVWQLHAWCARAADAAFANSPAAIIWHFRRQEQE